MISWLNDWPKFWKDRSFGEIVCSVLQEVLGSKGRKYLHFSPNYLTQEDFYDYDQSPSSPYIPMEFKKSDVEKLGEKENKEILIWKLKGSTKYGKLVD